MRHADDLVARNLWILRCPAPFLPSEMGVGAKDAATKNLGPNVALLGIATIRSSRAGT
jgi:hypothetical protein